MSDLPLPDVPMIVPARTTPVLIGVLLFDGYDELDVIGPTNVFHATRAARPFTDSFAPVEVLLVGPGPGLEPVASANGVRLVPDTTMDDCPPLDVLVVPGGSGANDAGGRHVARNDPRVIAFVRAQRVHAPLVMSVCTGTFVLAGAGLLAGRRANTHWAARADLVALMEERGEPFTLLTERVVDDGDLLSAGGVSSGIDLALHVVARLFGPQVGGIAGLAIERDTERVPAEA